MAEGIGSCDGYSFAASMGMLCVDGAIYALATAYFISVLSNDNGPKRHCLFPFYAIRNFVGNAISSATPLSIRAQEIELEDDCDTDGAFSEGIVINSLSKVYLSFVNRK